MKFLGDREPWLDITSALKKNKSKVYCAIGYIGIDAWKYLPLRAGDILICDASDAAVKTGATNPKGLIPFIQKDVEVFSRPGLHAKVIANSQTAWVGSANASANSANGLVEASVRLDSALAVKSTKAFVLEQRSVSVQLDLADVRELSKLIPKRMGRGPVAIRPTFDFPETLDSLHILNTKSWNPTPKMQELIDANERAVNRKKIQLGKGSVLGTLYGSEDWTANPGEWVCSIFEMSRNPKEDIVFPPALIVDVTGSKKKPMYWFAEPKKAVKYIKKIELEKATGIRFSKSSSSEVKHRIANLIVDQFRI